MTAQEFQLGLKKMFVSPFPTDPKYWKTRVGFLFFFFKFSNKMFKTRQFSNHESRLLSRAHTFAIIVILDFKIHQSIWIHWSFFPKNLNQRSLTPTWPLTPCLLRSHVWLYLRIIVSKSHDNTSMYVDTVINLANYQIHTHTTYIHTQPISFPQRDCTAVWLLTSR